jgi:hypothetical protein
MTAFLGDLATEEMHAIDYATALSATAVKEIGSQRH